MSAILVFVNPPGRLVLFSAKAVAAHFPGNTKTVTTGFAVTIQRLLGTEKRMFCHYETNWTKITSRTNCNAQKRNLMSFLMLFYLCGTTINFPTEYSFPL